MAKRSPMFWILAAAGGLGVCCVIPSCGLLVLGLLSPDSRTPSNTVAPAIAADDFVYQSDANGLTWVANATVSAEGAAGDVAGIWREDNRNVILKLDRGGQYVLTESSSSYAGGLRGDETGRWSFSGGVLTLTPQSVKQDGFTASDGHVSSGRLAPDAPRAWAVTAVTLVYHPPAVDDKSVMRQRPGLRIKGTAPTWSSANGSPFEWVVRSAPQ